MPDNDHLKRLEDDGVVVLENLLPPATLRSMQESFAARLRGLRFSDREGYERTEPYRLMVQNVLALDQGFLDLALHPTVLRIAEAYLGPAFRLCEAKGWKSLATRREFHGWHGDAWYDQRAASSIHRELKLALYLSSVESGEFQYVLGSHRRQHPRAVKDHELETLDTSGVRSVMAPAGTAFLFDTSGVHRQATPILTDRSAVFLAYHDPSVPLQAEDLAYYRYHPLLLNAAFLGDLSEEHQRVLGFGDRSNYIHAFEREVQFPQFLKWVERGWSLRLRADRVFDRVRRRIFSRR